MSLQNLYEEMNIAVLVLLLNLSNVTNINSDTHATTATAKSYTEPRLSPLYPQWPVSVPLLLYSRGPLLLYRPTQ